MLKSWPDPPSKRHVRKIVTPEGLFIYDRESGYCLHEPRIRSKAWVKPLYAQIALTYKCNMKCWFCYACSSPDSAAEYSAKHLKELLAFLDRWGLFGVAFGGGEPFLHPHLTSIAKWTWLNTGLDVSVTTNGYAASKEQIRKIEGYVSEVRVSVRRVGDCRVLKKFLGRKFELGVNILVFHGAADEIRRIIEECLQLGVRDFLLNDFRTVGRGAGWKRMEPDRGDYRALAALVNSLRGKASVKASTRLAEKLAEADPSLKPLPFRGERRGRIIAITPDGRVKPSSLVDEAYPFRKPEEIPALYIRFANKPGNPCSKPA